MLKKLITYCPTAQIDKVRDALFRSGGGEIGEYDECSFTSEGTGTFRASAKAQPFVGKAGVRHYEKETKIEMLYPSYLENKLVSTLKEAHPYEEVAYDCIPLHNRNAQIGAGIIGELAQEMDEMEFLKKLKTTFNAGCVRYTALGGKKIKTVALCGGSGSFLLKEAMVAQADIFITADYKYHQFFDAENRIVIADIGHYESEQFTKELLYDIIRKKFSTFALRLTKINSNPINYL